MYDEILYPTGGSSTAHAALYHARNRAERHDATVHVLYVVDMEHAGVGLVGDIDLGDTPGMIGAPAGSELGTVGTRGDASIDDLKSEAAEVVEHVADGFGGVETRTAVRSGTAYEAILKYADEAGIDMVVTSTHGRSGIDRYVIGSVTEKVVRFADVPVLTVRADDD
jgi:nucleotide-binding universal stress UspA family protein